MFILRDIYLQYGDRILFDHINLVIKNGEKIALIGKNGAGKTTLLKIIGKELSPDAGELDFPSNCNVGYLKQEIDFTNDISILEETMSCFQQVNKIQQEIDNINVALGEREDYSSDAYSELVEKLSSLTHRLSILGAGNIEGTTVKVLTGLGFKESELTNSIKTLSGGWKMRVELAKLLLTEPDLLLLDEPTNHLDIESIIWLENYLREYPKTVILISHDKEFLNNTAKRVIEIELGRLLDIKGNYAHFLKEKEQQKEVMMASYANQQKMIAEKEKTINRFMAKATKTKMAQSMKKQLDKIERIQIQAEDNAALRLDFSDVPRSSLIMAKAANMSKAYGNKQVLSNIDFQLERGEKVAFVGQNGQGKTTLARILANDLSISNGSIETGNNIFLSYYAQNQTDLLPLNHTVLEVAESAAPASLRPKVRSILGGFLFSGEDVEKKVSVLSGGEKARLALACMIMHPSNFILLDEPTNHLDMKSKDILKEALQRYTGALIVVSHDRDFLNGLTDKVYEFRDQKIKEYLGDIEYFLEKRKVETLRDVELQTNTSQKINTASNSSLTYEEKKALQRKLKYCERDIERLEKQIENYNIKISETTNYQSDEFIMLNKSLKTSNEELEEKMEEWESIMTEIGD